ncbi:MAG: exopolysaccharide biosynthesis polyprenyl glycosylphosphotransferase [Patescibacteria group bacterium]
MIAQKAKTAVFLIGDIAILYGALVLTLLIRYGQSNFYPSLLVHIKPFSFLFIVWFLIFYLSNLYDDKFYKHNIATIQAFILAIAINIAISIILLYIFSDFFKLTPKTNLLIFGAVYGAVDYFWRLILTSLFISGGLKKQIMLIGNSTSINSIAEYLKNNPQIGYAIKSLIQEGLSDKNFSDIVSSITSKKIYSLVIDDKIKSNPLGSKLIYRLLPLDIQIIDSSLFFETLFNKVPLDELEESWFIESIVAGRKIYDAAKKSIDFLMSLLLLILFSPLMILISIIIKLTSEGPIIFKQERIGKGEMPFVLYKFRTMIINHNGSLWTEKNDSRLTFIGKIIRYTHLDELPQLVNILKGNISFIGPRPERSELVQMYKKLPYYEIRHIIKPGLTGWAQLNYKPSASLEEAYKKLQYDVYYIKNRSLLLDFLIVLKTIRYFFISHQ